MIFNIYKSRWIFSAFLVIVMGCFSCKKYLEIKLRPDTIGSDQAFADSSTAAGVINGLYANIASGNQTAVIANSVGWGISTYGAMSADDGYYLTKTEFDVFKNNQLAAGNSANVLWSGLYGRIARANYAIEGLSKSALSGTVKNQFIAESKFMRAWLYFYLVNYFGDVPLVLTADALETSKYPRTSTAEVYQQIVKDLTEAEAALSVTYPSSQKARVNKYAASALLARVYFYLGKWSEAESKATTVINSNVYSIVTDMNSVFLNNSAETIWQISLQSTNTPQTIFGSEYLPAGTTPSFVLYDTLANTFEANDLRKTYWAQSISYLSKKYYYPYKFKVRTTTTGNEYPVMLRLAELYLIRAEAKANVNNISEAQNDLNVIRKRAGLGNTSASTQAELLTALQHERWVELFSEFGDRWFNLKRLNIATDVLSKVKPAWQSFQQLYPIPTASITANPNLKDNPGY